MRMNYLDTPLYNTTTMHALHKFHMGIEPSRLAFLGIGFLEQERNV